MNPYTVLPTPVTWTLASLLNVPSLVSNRRSVSTVERHDQRNKCQHTIHSVFLKGSRALQIHFGVQLSLHSLVGLSVTTEPVLTACRSGAHQAEGSSMPSYRSHEALVAIRCLRGQELQTHEIQQAFQGYSPLLSVPRLLDLSMVMDINTEIHYYRYYEKHGFRLLGFNALLGVRLFLDSDESLSKGCPKTQHENQTMKYQQTSEMN